MRDWGNAHTLLPVRTLALHYQISAKLRTGKQPARSISYMMNVYYGWIFHSVTYNFICRSFFAQRHYGFSHSAHLRITDFSCCLVSTSGYKLKHEGSYLTSLYITHQIMWSVIPRIFCACYEEIGGHQCPTHRSKNYKGLWWRNCPWLLWGSWSQLIHTWMQYHITPPLSLPFGSLFGRFL